MTDDEIAELAKKQEKGRQELHQKALEASWVRISSTHEGRRVLLDILSLCEPLARSLDTESFASTAEREGARKVGAYIISQIGLQAWAKMVEEDEGDELSPNYKG